MVFTMLTILWVAYCMSNYREVRALWQMQRHALVHHYHFAVKLAEPSRWNCWPLVLCRRYGLLNAPPVVDGRAVEPVVGDEPVPELRYFKSFVAWRAYTSPKQLHVQLVLLAAEMVLVLGVLGFLLPLTGLSDSVLDPIKARIGQ